MASGSELSLDDFARTWLQLGGTLVCPRVTGQGHMSLRRLCAFEELEPGFRGLLEPPTASDEFPCEALDLLLVPGLAFDRHGGRLGQGGGYYDRLLATGRPKQILGIAFSAQIIPQVPMSTYDVRVDGVLTEAGIAQDARWQLNGPS